MPKTKPPKLCQDKSKKTSNAFVLIDGKKHYLPGQWGSPEVKAEYARFQLEWWENYRNPTKAPTISLVQDGNNADTTIGYLAAEYLAHVEGTMHPKDYGHVNTVIFDFLLKLYPDTFPANSFTPKCLKLVRTSMVQSRRFCRKVINGYIKRIVAVFQWGTGEDIVSGSTLHALKAVKALRKTERRRCYTTRRHK